MDNDKRVLRSRQPKQTPLNGSSSLFHFDARQQVLIEPGYAFVVSHDKSSQHDEIYRFYGDLALVPPPEAKNGGLNVTVVDPQPETASGSIGTRLRSEIDPLEDAVYGNFHRKMRREEKLMLNLERNDVLSEVDNLNHHLQLLHQYDWIRHLPSITSINDPNDYAELETKKKLTVVEINKILRKYDNWKRRYDRLTNDIRVFNQNPLPADSYEEDEYSMPVAQLRQRRLAQKRKLLGPIIKLKLNNGYVIIYDPEKPFVSVEEDLLTSKTSSAFSTASASLTASKPAGSSLSLSPQKQRKSAVSSSKMKPVQRKRQLNSNTVALTPHSRRRLKQDAYTSTISTPSEYQGYSTGKTHLDPIELEPMTPKTVLKLSFQNDKQNNMALGLVLPLGGYQDFQLYRGWLVKANDFLNQRLSFREELDRLIPDSQES